MSRLGFLCDEAHLDHAAEEIAALCALPGLRAEGIFTHFSDADGCEAYTMRQFTRFLDLLDKLSARGRALFYRKYYYLQPTDRIAAELGTTPRAVEGRLYRIRKRLQEQLGGDAL